MAKNLIQPTSTSASSTINKTNDVPVKKEATTYTAPGKSHKAKSLIEKFFPEMNGIKISTKGRETVRSSASISGKKDCSRAAEATKSIKSPLPPKNGTSETMQLGNQREDKAQKKLSGNRDLSKFDDKSKEMKNTIARGLINEAIGPSDFTEFTDAQRTLFSKTLDSLLMRKSELPTWEGLMVMEAMLPRIQNKLDEKIIKQLSVAVAEKEQEINIPETEKMEDTNKPTMEKNIGGPQSVRRNLRRSTQKEKLVSREKFNENSLKAKALNAASLIKKMNPAATPLQQKDGFIPAATSTVMPQETALLNALLHEDDLEIDRMLDNLNSDALPEMDDLKKLTQEIEKEFAPLPENQNNKGRPLSQFVPRNNMRKSTQAEQTATKQFVKEHNKIAKTSDVTKPAINTAPEKKVTVSADRVDQELDELMSDLAAMENIKHTEEPAVAASADDFDNAISELEQVPEKKTDRT